jgi:hypothetical protein
MRVDLCDVLVKIRYSKVIIEIPKELTEKYKPNREASKGLNFTLRDVQGKVIYAGPLPELAFDPTFSYVNLALPQGSWKVDFSLGDNKQLRPAAVSLHIAGLSCKKVTVVGDTPIEQPCQ